MNSHEFAKKILALADKPLRIWTGEQHENCDCSLIDGGEYVEVLISAKQPNELLQANWKADE
jgi:hypothetical protein